MTETNEIEVVGDFASDEELFWIDMAKTAIRNKHKNYDDPAKQIITVSGVLQGLYFVAISFSTLKDELHLNCIRDYIFGLIFILPVVLWLASLHCAINVLMPQVRPKKHERSKEDIKGIWQVDMDRKARHLILAQKFLVAGFFILVISICCYLIMFHAPDTNYLYNNSINNSS